MLSASYAPSLINFRGPLIEKFVNASIEIVAIAPDIDKKLQKKLENMGCQTESIKLVRNKINIFGDLIYLVQLIFLLIKHRPHLLVSYTVKPNVYGAIAAKILRVPSVSMVTGLGSNLANPKRGFRFLMTKNVFKLAIFFNRLVIFQNQDDIKDLQDMKVLSKAKEAALVNGSGVDTEFFAVEPLPEKLSFLMLARFVKSKGIIEYAEAAKYLIDRGYAATFFLAGHDDYGPDQLDRTQLKRNYGKYIKIFDEVDDVRPLIRSASVYVLPSYREGTPRSVLEAMSMGRPIITTDAPGCRETVIDKENGFLIEPQNVDSLLSALIDFCLDQEKIEVMGAKSRELVLQKFEINLVTQQYFKHISKMIDVGQQHD